MVTFGGFAALGADNWKIKLLTRTATPLFVFMFGMMLELVYVRQAGSHGMAGVRERLFRRSAQCLAGYLLTVLAGVVGGNLDLSEGVKAAFFLQNAQFGNILRFYSIALLLVIPLVSARTRYGSWLLAVLLIGVWIGDLLLKQFANTSFGPVTPWVGVFLGTGTFRDGPSVWHGMTFVLAGMLVAASLRDWREAGLRRFYVTAGVLALSASLIILVLVMNSSATEVARRFADYSYRARNHIGYYAVGLLACSLTLMLLARLIPREKPLSRWTSLPLALGHSSLLSYSLGNILLNLMPAAWTQSQPWLAIGASLLFLLVMTVLVYLYSAGRSRVALAARKSVGVAPH